MISSHTAKAIFLGLCPHCGRGPLFHGYISVRKNCGACGLDYTIFAPGDGPAVFVVQIVGTIVCGLALWVEFTFQPPWWVHVVLWTPLIAILTAIFLRLIKSALLVLQHRNKAGEGTPL